MTMSCLNPFFTDMGVSLRNATRSYVLIVVGVLLWCAIWCVWIAGAGGMIAPVFAGTQAGNQEITIRTIAGGGFGSNVPVRDAPMVQPTAVVFDPLGRGFYVVDEVNGTSLLRFVNTTENPITLAGTTIEPNRINLIAGGGIQFNDGATPRDSDLAQITGITVSHSGNLVFLSTPAFGSIRVINVGTQNTLAYGKAINPATISTIKDLEFIDFRGLTIHPTTDDLYFIAGRLIHKIDTGGTLVAVAGGAPPSPGNGDGGPATGARLLNPMALAFDTNGNMLIADGGDTRSVAGNLRRVNTSNIISTIATGLEFPTGLTVAPNGDAYVALGNAQQIMRVTPTGQKTVVVGNNLQVVCDTNLNPTCGDGGPAVQANLSIPDSTAGTTLILSLHGQGLYLPDFRYKRVRFVNLGATTVKVLDKDVTPQSINTIVGSGVSSPYDEKAATYAELFVPTGIAVDTLGNLFIADTGNNRLRFVNRTTSPVTLFVTTPYATTVQPGQIVTLNRDAGNLQQDDRVTTSYFLSPQGLETTARGLLIVDSQAGALIKVPPASVTGRRSGVIRFLNTSNADVTFFASNSEAKVVIPPGQIKDIAGVRPPANPQMVGDGMAANKVAFFPTDIAVDDNGNLYIADQGNNRIRRIDVNTGIVSTAYGDGTTTTLNGPTGIAFDLTGRLLIADTRNNRILREDAPGAVAFSIIAGNSNGISRPRDLVVAENGKIYITNAITHQIMSLTAPENSNGTTTVIAGNGNAGFSGDNGPALLARLSMPNPGTAINDIQVTTNIAVLSDGNLIFTDTNNNRVRMLEVNATSVPVASVSAASFSEIELAAESIVAAFGQDLATETQIAPTTPLPTILGGTSMRITDSFGIERPVPLFFVAPNQINYQLPAGAFIGNALLRVFSGSGAISSGSINIVRVAPGLFSANATGQGVAAAIILRLKADGSQTFEPVGQFDTGQNRFVHVPIDLGPETDQLFLILYGTGFRNRTSLGAVSVTMGGTNSEVLYAGLAEGFVGLDQANIRIPRSLANRGVITVVMSVEGKVANSLTVEMK